MTQDGVLREVRYSRYFHRLRRTVLLLTILFLLLFGAGAGVSVSNTADYLTNGKTVEATVVGRRSLVAKNPSYELRLTYRLDNRPRTVESRVSKSAGDELPVGKKVMVRVRPSHPNEVWLGRLEKADLDNRIAILILGLIVGVVNGVVFFNSIGRAAAEQMVIATTWTKCDGTLKRVGAVEGRHGHRAITVGYRDRDQDYSFVFDSREAFAAEKAIPLYIHPHLPERASAVASMRYVEER